MKKVKKWVSVLLIAAISLSLCIGSAFAEDQVDIPSGYTYSYGVKQNVGWEVKSISVSAGMVTGIALSSLHPAIGTIAAWIASELGEAFGNFMVGDSIAGYYYDYVYECDDPGIYPYIYFHALYYYAKDQNGVTHLVDMEGRYEYALLPR